MARPRYEDFDRMVIYQYESGWKWGKGTVFVVGVNKHDMTEQTFDWILEKGYIPHIEFSPVFQDGEGRWFYHGATRDPHYIGHTPVKGMCFSNVEPYNNNLSLGHFTTDGRTIYI